MLKTLAARVGKYRIVAIMTPIFTMLEALMEMLMPVMMAKIIDEGIDAGNMANVWRYGGIMVGMAALALTFGILAGRFAARASTGFAANLRADLFRNIQNFSFANIDRYSTAGLVTRLTTDVNQLQMSFQMLTRMCVRAPVSMIFAIIMAVSVSPRLSLVFLIAMAALMAILLPIAIPGSRRFREVFKQYDALNAGVQENVAGIRVVKAFVREKFENEKFRAAAGSIYRAFVGAETRMSFVNPVMILAIYGCNMALSWFGASMVVGGELTTGELQQMFSYVMNILLNLMMLGMVFIMLTMSSASAQRVAEVLNEESDLTSPPDAVTAVAEGSVEFRGVSFAYSTGSANPVLQDINLQIRSGETVGILGGTGSAKSSLVNLIPRLYDVTAGSVLVGGRDVREYDLDALRSEVSVVLQKNVLFSGTVLENLRWGAPNATEEECAAACRLACADDFIRQMPEGYQSRVERGGSNLSGGQKQRLCIARALLKKPKVLILDDSTSAVDTATDARIRQAFRDYLPETTKLIIAQRISSVQDADRILVLEAGRVLAFDTHAELMADCGVYREIYENQTRGSGDFDRMGGED